MHFLQSLKKRSVTYRINLLPNFVRSLPRNLKRKQLRLTKRNKISLKHSCNIKQQNNAYRSLYAAEKRTSLSLKNNSCFQMKIFLTSVFIEHIQYVRLEAIGEIGL